MDLDWNDLRYLLEIERTQTIRAAAAKLRIHHTTISRHLNELQDRLGVQLLQRQGRRLVFTKSGQELLVSARQIEQEITRASRKLAGQDQRLSGKVRIGATESVLHLLVPHILKFLALYPALDLEFSAGLDFKNLARMEADIVLRVVSSPHDTLVGRLIAPVKHYAYGHNALLQTLEASAVSDYPWIGWSDHLAHFPMEAWLRRQLPSKRPHITTDSESTLIKLISEGTGVGFLPSFVGKSLPHLKKLKLRDTPTFDSQAWILMHEDLRSVPRVKAVSQWLFELCRELF